MTAFSPKDILGNAEKREMDEFDRLNDDGRENPYLRPSHE